MIKAINQTKPDLVFKLRKVQQSKKRKAFFMVLPLLAFITFAFIIPIFKLLYTSFDNYQVSFYLPELTKALGQWADQSQLPQESVFTVLVADLKKARANETVGQVARRINFAYPGGRSILNKLARKAHTLNPPYKESVLAFDSRWESLLLWQTLLRESKPYTLSYYLSAFDLTYNDKQEIVRQSESKRIYMALFFKTIWVSLLITFICFLLGFPVAHMLSTLPTKIANLLMIMVLLPFWTSLLVRTTSWIVLLQTQGLINDMAVYLGVIDDSQRVRMVYNLQGTIIAMTHILLPFMILPLYSVMKTIPPSYMYAARSMGSSWFYAFRSIYFPLTLPGLSAGGLLVFILSIGYFITPALVGGSSGILISNMIDYHVNQSLNWGLASSLSAILFITVIILYWLYNKLIGVEKLKF